MAKDWFSRLRRKKFSPAPKKTDPRAKPVYAAPWLLGVLLAIWLAAFLSPHFRQFYPTYEVGQFTTRAIKAPADFRVVDEATTRAKREEARDAVPPVYDYDPQHVVRGIERLSDAFAAMRSFYVLYDVPEPVPIIEPSNPDAEPKLQPGHPPMALRAVPQELERERLETFAATVGVDWTAEELAVLARYRFRVEIEEETRGVIATATDGLVVADIDLFLGTLLEEPNAKAFVKRDIHTQQEQTVGDLSVVSSFQALKERLPALIADMTPEEHKPLAPLVSDLAMSVVKPTLYYNSDETTARQRSAYESVTTVERSFKKGQLILGEGREVTDETVMILEQLFQAQAESWPVVGFLGIAVLVYLLMAAVFQFSQQHIRKAKLENKDVLFLFVVTGMTVTLAWVAYSASAAISESFDTIPLEALYYGIPLAAAAMIVRFILNSEIALAFAVLISALLGILFDQSMAIALFWLVSGVMGAHWVGHTSHRYALMTAGLKLGVLNAGLIAAIEMFQGSTEGFQALDFVLTLTGGFLGGVLAGLFVLALTPLAEILFSYTTDVKLLELANMNHPLLKEMVIKAPGTYNHSILVATLAENAAEAIGANPLLSKVGGLYQDIGKLAKPHYFIENQRDGFNPHDRLYPRMSSLILLSHVKEGVERGHKHKLGDPVIDIIQQHHGTGLIKFFYKRALEMEDPKMESVAEADFRYAGPKPQTREAGIVMLADIIEATSRSLKNPTTTRIGSVIEQSIDNCFREGQLDECELTLRDLNAIGQAFQKVLTGLFHTRIEYPDGGAEPGRKKIEAERKRAEAAGGRRGQSSDSKRTENGPNSGGEDPQTGDDDTKVVKIR